MPLAALTDGELILIAGMLLALALGAAFIADRVRVPGLLLFLGLGMIVGVDRVTGVDFDDVELTRTLGIVGLSLILFEGGLSAGWKEVRPVLAPALALAIAGTAITAILGGLAAKWLFGLSTLEGLIVGSAIAATDSAAIFAVLRGSTLRRRLARTLEGESGMNDPVALLLVVGFIDWIQIPGFNGVDLIAGFFVELSLGAMLGAAVGLTARQMMRTLELPSTGLYPIATLAAAAVSYGIAEVAGGSGFFSVYMTGLALGTGQLPSRRTVIAFHNGLAWVSQIAFFFVLGLLVVPSQLGEVAGEGLLLSAALMFVARPAASLIATTGFGFSIAERLMLGWAGLRGAIPIWLATFPVIAGVPGSDQLFTVIFFVVVTSTLVQGVTFEPLAHRLGLTTSEPALPRPLLESGRIRRLGGEIVAYRVTPTSAASGRMIKELGLPRDALVNVIVRNGEALPPRGSTVIEAGDELHMLVRQESREEVTDLVAQWSRGELVPRPRARPKLRGAPQVFTLQPWDPGDGDPSHPERVLGVGVLGHLRTRRDSDGALVELEDGRFAVTSGSYVAVGGRRHLSNWCERRARGAADPAEQSWWQEVVGALYAPAGR